jgi:hypothetical protein
MLATHFAHPPGEQRAAIKRSDAASSAVCRSSVLLPMTRLLEKL